MANLRLVIACIAIFTLAFLLQIKNVQAATVGHSTEDHTRITDQLNTIETAVLWDERTSLNISCNDVISGEPSIEMIYKSYHIKNVHIFRCKNPRSSYVDLLDALGVNVAEVEEVSLLGVPDKVVLEAKHFAGLPINKLSIYGSHYSRRMLQPKVGFLDPLAELRELTVVNVELPPLPESLKLEVLHLKSGSSVGDFGNCAHLQFLTVEQWAVPSNAAPWLAHCPKLRSVRLVDLPPHMPTRVLTGTRKVFYLSVSNCSISVLTKDLLSEAKDLSQLHLPHNNMVSIANDAFVMQKSLQELNLAHNNLNGEELKALLSLQSLRVLSASHNQRLNFCEHFRENLPISDLSLSDTGLTDVCFQDWTTLVLFNLTNNKIATLDFEKLPVAVSRGRALEVSLRGNPVTEVIFPKSLYLKLTELRQTSSSPRASPRGVEPFARVSLDVTIHCTQEHMWLVKAIREDLIEIRSIHCDDVQRTPLARYRYHDDSGSNHDLDSGHNGQDEPEDRDNDRSTNPAEALASFNCGGCQCHRSEDNGVIANCASGTVRAIPRVNGLKELHAVGNLIKDFVASDLPETLIMMDIRDNKVSHLDEETAKALFAGNRRIRLAGNPIACDCDNVAFLAELFNYDTQVLDFRDLKCANSGRTVRGLQVAELCENTKQTDESEDPPPTKDRAAMSAVASVASVAFALLTAFTI